MVRKQTTLKCLNLIGVPVVFDVTAGRVASLATVVEVHGSVRHSRKQHVLRAVPAAVAAVTRSRAVATHVVDHGVHEYPVIITASTSNQ